MGNFNPSTLSWCLALNKFYRKVAERSQACWRWYPFPQVFSASLSSGFFWDLCSWKAREQHCPKIPLSLNCSPELGHVPRLLVPLLHSNEIFGVFLIRKSCQKRGKPKKYLFLHWTFCFYSFICKISLNSRWALCSLCSGLAAPFLAALWWHHWHRKLLFLLTFQARICKFCCLSGCNNRAKGEFETFCCFAVMNIPPSVWGLLFGACSRDESTVFGFKTLKIEILFEISQLSYKQGSEAQTPMIWRAESPVKSHCAPF